MTVRFTLTNLKADVEDLGTPDGLEILVFGAPSLGEDPRGDVEGQRGWWTDS